MMAARVDTTPASAKIAERSHSRGISIIALGCLPSGIRSSRVYVDKGGVKAEAALKTSGQSPIKEDPHYLVRRVAGRDDVEGGKSKVLRDCRGARTLGVISRGPVTRCQGNRLV